MRLNRQRLIALALIAGVGIVVLWRLALTLKVALASISLFVVLLWALLIPVKILALVKVRDWRAARTL